MRSSFQEQASASRTILLYSRIARWILPNAFLREFGSDIERTLIDRYCTDRRCLTAAGRLRFWLREIGGLALTAYQETLNELAHRRRRSGRQVHPPSPKRELGMVGSFKKDLLLALRMIVKTPVVTIIAVVSLAVGVAANTTVFSLVHSWLLRPLPYPNAERLVMAWENPLLETGDQALVAPANFFDWRAQSTSFDAWIAWQYRPANLTGIERPEQLTIANVTPNYFSVLDAQPMLGRTFREDEGGAEDAPTLVMGETIWKTRFGSSPQIVGSTVTLDGRRYTVVGVMPETFDFLLGNVSMWIAADFRDQQFDREDHSLLVTARLTSGISLEAAQAEMTTITSRLADLYPETNQNYGANIQRIRDMFPGPSDRGLIKILMSVVLLVLCVACVNVSSLLMAKSDARRREMGIRIALGAGRARLISQLLTESVVLALIGGTFGVALSLVGINAVAGAMPPEMPAFFHPHLSGPVIGYTVAISVLAGVMFGIAPAVHALSSGGSSPLVTISEILNRPPERSTR